MRWIHAQEHKLRFCIGCAPKTRRGTYKRTKCKPPRSTNVNARSCADAAGETARVVFTATPASDLQTANAPQCFRRRGTELLDAEPEMRVASLTAPSTMAASAVVADISAYNYAASEIGSIRERLQSMYPLVKGALGMDISLMTYRGAGFLLRRVGECVETSFQSLSQQQKRVSLLALLVLGCESHGAFAEEKRFAIDSDVIEVTVRTLYKLWGYDITSQTVKKAEWRWLQAWIGPSFQGRRPCI